VDAPDDVDAPFVHIIIVTPATATVAPGCTEQFTATAVYSDNTESNATDVVQWVSDDPSIASVTAAGLATGLQEGDSAIRATWPGPPSITSQEAFLDVGSPAVLSVTVEPPSAFVVIGDSVALEAYVDFADCYPPTKVTSVATWSSSDEAIATVVSSGAVTGVGLGTATITAEWSGYQAPTEVTVTQ